MNILALDQSRNGAWCVFDYDAKEIIAFNDFSFPAEDYTFAKAIVNICDIVGGLILEHNISAVFFEDIQLRQNVDSFKKLAQLQGSLVCMFEKNEYLYDYVPPTRWQNYCNARGRTTKEIKSKYLGSEIPNIKKSKALSIQFVKDQYNIETTNDNIADAICIGHYVVHNVTIRSHEGEE